MKSWVVVGLVAIAYSQNSLADVEAGGASDDPVDSVGLTVQLIDDGAGMCVFTGGGGEAPVVALSEDGINLEAYGRWLQRIQRNGALRDVAAASAIVAATVGYLKEGSDTRKAEKAVSRWLGDDRVRLAKLKVARSLAGKDTPVLSADGESLLVEVKGKVQSFDVDSATLRHGVVGGLAERGIIELTFSPDDEYSVSPGGETQKRYRSYWDLVLDAYEEELRARIRSSEEAIKLAQVRTAAHEGRKNRLATFGLFIATLEAHFLMQDIRKVRSLARLNATQATAGLSQEELVKLQGHLASMPENVRYAPGACSL